VLEEISLYQCLLYVLFGHECYYTSTVHPRRLSILGHPSHSTTVAPRCEGVCVSVHPISLRESSRQLNWLEGLIIDRVTSQGGRDDAHFRLEEGGTSRIGSHQIRQTASRKVTIVKEIFGGKRLITNQSSRSYRTAVRPVCRLVIRLYSSTYPARLVTHTFTHPLCSTNDLDLAVDCGRLSRRK